MLWSTSFVWWTDRQNVGSYRALTHAAAFYWITFVFKANVICVLSILRSNKLKSWCLEEVLLFDKLHWPRCSDKIAEKLFLRSQKGQLNRHFRKCLWILKQEIPALHSWYQLGICSAVSSKRRNNLCCPMLSWFCWHTVLPVKFVSQG